jgi:kynurenine formamidase
MGSIDIDLLGEPIDISIPLRFDGPQPNAFGVEPATAKTCEYGDLVGDTRRGGSCNFEQITLIPHCNGTHTECVGHITNERISIRDCLKDAFVRAVLISIEPTTAGRSTESYAVHFGANDLLITKASIAIALSGSSQKADALVVRTLPNVDSKLTRQYSSEPMPPFFTTDAMEYIVARGFKHLLVDLPSIDRLNDEGKLSNHRIFWNVPEGSRDADAGTRRESTITELIYIPNDVDDGEYLLNLQIAPFESDASPSRPLLFKIEEADR